MSLVKNILLLIVITCSCLCLPAQTYYRGNVALEAFKLYKSADLQHKLGNVDVARSLYQKALLEDDRFIEAMDNLGDIYRKKGLLDSAVYYYQMSLDLEPEGILAYQNLAATYQLQEKYDEAIGVYVDLLDQYPNYPEAYYGLGKLFLLQKDYFRSQYYANIAIAKFLKEKESHRAADARLLAGRSYLAHGNYKKAIRYFKANRKYFSQKAFYPYYIGVGYLKLGKEQKARKYLEKAEIRGYQLPVYVTERLTFLGKS